MSSHQSATGSLLKAKIPAILASLKKGNIEELNPYFEDPQQLFEWTSDAKDRFQFTMVAFREMMKLKKESPEMEPQISEAVKLINNRYRSPSKSFNTPKHNQPGNDAPRGHTTHQAPPGEPLWIKDLTSLLICKKLHGFATTRLLLEGIINNLSNEGIITIAQTTKGESYINIPRETFKKINDLGIGSPNGMIANAIIRSNYLENTAARNNEPRIAANQQHSSPDQNRQRSSQAKPAPASKPQAQAEPTPAPKPKEAPKREAANTEFATKAEFIEKCTKILTEDLGGPDSSAVLKDLRENKPQLFEAVFGDQNPFKTKLFNFTDGFITITKDGCMKLGEEIEAGNRNLGTLAKFFNIPPASVQRKENGPVRIKGDNAPDIDPRDMGEPPIGPSF